MVHFYLVSPRFQSLAPNLGGSLFFLSGLMGARCALDWLIIPHRYCVMGRVVGVRPSAPTQSE